MRHRIARVALRTTMALGLAALIGVAVVLGTGRMSVRECLYLKPKTVIPLEQPAGSDLHVRINGVLIAHGEVAIVDDSTNVRLTAIVPPPSGEDA